MPDRKSVPTTKAPTRQPHRASGPGAADLAAIAVGGGIGSVARYLLSAAFPAGLGFPWAIFAVNVSGCFCLGFLMVYLLEVWPPRRFLRPFLAVGLLGGYTTFSTYAGGVMTLLTSHAASAGRCLRAEQHLRCPGRGMVRHEGGPDGGKAAGRITERRERGAE